MRPRRESETTIEADDTDRDLFRIFQNAFSVSPTINPGLKHLIDDIKPILKDLINRDAAFANLEETIGNLSNRYSRYSPPNIKTMLASMLVGVIKQTNTSLGSASPVYIEEVEWMAEEDSNSSIASLKRCMLHGRNRIA